MTYTICLQTYTTGIRDSKEYKTEGQARKGAIALVKKKDAHYVYIFETSVWESIRKKSIRKDDDVYKHAIGYVYPPMPTFYKSNPMRDNFTFWYRGFEKGYTLNADGSFDRPTKETKNGTMKFADLPKKKKTEKRSGPFGL
ncbi:MAG: hypothetical protein IIY21_05195 [Clostridiales bacterium]|nr:hypothetical protein [Clostridiales bacterium]